MRYTSDNEPNVEHVLETTCSECGADLDRDLVEKGKDLCADCSGDELNFDDYSYKGDEGPDREF